MSHVALSVGCSSVNSQKSDSLFNVHEKSERNVASSPDGNGSIFGGDDIDANRPYTTTYTHESVDKFHVFCGSEMVVYDRKQGMRDAGVAKPVRVNAYYLFDSVNKQHICLLYTSFSY